MTVNLNDKQKEKLREIVQTTLGTATDGVFAYPIAMLPMVNAGFVAAHPTLRDETNKMHCYRATQAGVEYAQSLDHQDATAGQAVAFGGPAGSQLEPQPQTVSTERAKLVSDDFEIESGIPLPQEAVNKRRGGARPDVYPFAKLEVGQSFFIPASEKRPEPWKAMVSTVNTAMARYAVPKDGEVRQNRKGETVPVMQKTKVFTLVKGDKNGQPGARVFRTA